MKSSIAVIATAVWGLLCVADAGHAATYAFATPNYSSDSIAPSPCPAGSCASLTTAMRMQGTFEVASPLAPNLPLTDIRAQLTGFSVTDGATTYAFGDPAVRLIRLEAATDANGAINNVLIYLNRWQDGLAGPHAVLDFFDWAIFFGNGNSTSVLHNGRCGSVQTYVGVPDSCLTGNTTYATIGTTPGGSALLFVPGAPAIDSAVPGNGLVTLTFSPPASNGGAAITGYTATCGAQSASGPGPSIVVPGLANGVAVNCTVTATNLVGTGPPSVPAGAVPFSVPGAPVIDAATPGNGQATVMFTPPISTGGLAITGYTATCGAQSATGPGSPLTVVGLTNGTTYACTVTATNAAGTGPASGAVNVTPSWKLYTAPSATGSGTIAASFTGGGAGCSFSTPQYIAAPPGAPPVPASAPNNIAFPHGLFDFRLVACTPGSTTNFTITYATALPATAQYWKFGPTPGNATPHWYTLPATIAGNTVTFTLTDGGLGDDDLAANGTVVDQGGPGVPGAPGTATAVPTLSEWMLMLLAALMLGFVALRGRLSS